MLIIIKKSPPIIFRYPVVGWVPGTQYVSMAQFHHGLTYLWILASVLPAAALEEMVCTSEFTKTQLKVTCKAGKGHSRGHCMWKVFTESNFQNLGTSQDPQTDDMNRIRQYGTSCKILHTVTRAGLYRFKVSWYPDKASLDKSQNSTVKTTEYGVSVEPPSGPPIFVDSEGSPLTSTLEAEENKTVTLICQVPGGNPPVYETTISCPDMLDKSEPGQSVSLELNVTQDMSNQSCECSAHHIAGYTETASVTLLIKSSEMSSDGDDGEPTKLQIANIVIQSLVIIVNAFAIYNLSKIVAAKRRQKKINAEAAAALIGQPGNNNSNNNTEDNLIPNTNPDDNTEYYILFSPQPFTSTEMSLLKQTFNNGSVTCPENEANGGGHMVFIAVPANTETSTGEGARKDHADVTTEQSRDDQQENNQV